jgi:CHASE3 domain sensor protein
MLLQAMTPEMAAQANKVWEVNPYNALGYGLALLTLIVFCIVFYYRAKEAETYARELSRQMVEVNKDVLQVMVKVELRLNDQQPLLSGVQDIKTSMANLLNHSEQILRKIESSLK